MRVKRVLKFTEEKIFEPGEICIQGGIFAKDSDDDVVIDGEGCYAIPGLVDIHFHGCKGYDFCDGTKEAIEAIANYEAS
ncbi:MAG: N-acetylglucosamine-6-phosphate deacetylase, partial [Lachnospiraceae bacterium]